MKNNKILAVVGANRLRDYVEALAESSVYRVMQVPTQNVFDFVGSNRTEIIALVTELYHSRLPAGITLAESDGGFIAGAAIIKRLIPRCPKIIFFLFRGHSQSMLKEAANLVFLGDIRVPEPSLLLKTLEKKVGTRQKQNK